MCLTFHMWNICEVIYKWDTYVYHILVQNTVYIEYFFTAVPRLMVSTRQNNTVYIEYFFTPSLG